MLSKKYAFASLGLLTGAVLFVISAALNWDVFEGIVALIQKGEAYELDELVIPLLLVSIGVCCDFVRATQSTQNEQEKLDVYNKMNNEIMNEISGHLTKLLEFRTALMSDAPQAHDVRHELDRMIVTSFNHYERAQRRGDIDSSLMPLVMPESEPKSVHSQHPSQFK